jgi:hypothetical protein
MKTLLETSIIELRMKYSTYDAQTQAFVQTLVHEECLL